MIRIITTRRLEQLLGAQTRHERQNVILHRRVEELQREAEAAVEREGRLTADNAMLRQLLASHPEYRTVRSELRAATDRCAALDKLLSELQTANEGAYRDALAARLENHQHAAEQVPA